MITLEKIEVFRRVYTRKLATSTGVDREVVEAMLSMMDLALVGLAAEAADKARDRDAALGAAVREAVRVFAHPAYGEIDTLTMMATILRKKHHGFDSTPAFLDAIATHLRTEET